MKILLIDTGEIVESQPDTRGKFALSESAQKIPGRSIRCKVEEVMCKFRSNMVINLIGDDVQTDC